jgi:hypothetical protein
MSDKPVRNNPETGILEHHNGPLIGWGPKKNENGKFERINPKTGIVEEDDGFPYGWRPKN